MATNHHVETNATGFNNYNPIQTLDQQYAHPVGQRILLFVKLSANCTPNNGVQSLLHTTNNMVRGSSNRFAQPTSGNTIEIEEDEVDANGTPVNEDDDPFSFLGESGGAGNISSRSTLTSSTASSSSMGSGSLRRPGKSKLGSIKGFMKKSISKVEKSMTKLAIKADKGYNPDLYVCGLYDGLGTLWSMTDTISYKKKNSSKGDSHEEELITFGIPLILPSSISDDLNTTLTLKLWIKSGATLLKNVKNKNYLVGCIHLSVSDLRSAIKHTGNNSGTQTKQFESYGFVSYNFIPSTTTVASISGGGSGQQPKVHLCIVEDNKFPTLMGKAWSVTDPDMSGYTAGGLYNIPLDQSYLYANPKLIPPPLSVNQNWFVGTERAIESTIVLPVVTAYTLLLKDSCHLSVNHAMSVSKSLLANRHDCYNEGHNANCLLSISSLIISDPSKQVSSDISLHWQRPDCIFEVELLPASRISIHTTDVDFNLQTKENCAIKLPFYPKVCKSNFLGTILQQYDKQQKQRPSFLLGNVRVQINARVAQTTMTATQQQAQPVDTTCGPAGTVYVDEVWQAVICLDAYANTNGAPQQLKIPIYNTRTRQEMGKLMLYLECKMDATNPTPQQQSQDVPATGGLVSLVGINTFAEDTLPVLDYDPPLPPNKDDPNYTAIMQRRQQLSTMGNFITHQYLQQHIQNVRSVDHLDLSERYQEYYSVIQAASSGGSNPFGQHQQEHVPSHQDKTPKPFRPSSSRSTKLLSGIPFNVHNHSLSVNVLSNDEGGGAATTVGANSQPPKGVLYYDITCGCPADHARGYGNVLSSSPDEKNKSNSATPNSSQHGGSASNTNSQAAGGAAADGKNTPVGIIQGGLRRIEGKRTELSRVLVDTQTALIQSVGNYLRPLSQYGINHIPARHAETSGLRWRAFETTQLLHTLTWICSVRRGNVFSQALGIALTSYLVSISDMARVQAGWPDLWVRFGYLMSFEGLLSAAGNELGMIEDASVGIAMLRMCHIVLVDASKAPSLDSNNNRRVPVPHSPYIKFVEITTSGKGTYTQYRVEVGLDSIYYEQRVPQPLQNNASVQLYPILFEVGVDIRQWGKHSISNAKNSYTKKDSFGSSTSGTVPGQSPSASVRSIDPVGTDATSNGDIASSDDVGGLIDGENDDEGEAHNDVLVALNYEAFQKINGYANMISPPPPQQQTPPPGQQQQQVVYPGLRSLQNLIASSAGKMQFGILDEAATVTKSLGGGSAVFCKSGKDRTSMHYTYKASKIAVNYVHHYQQQLHKQQQPTIVDIPGVSTPVANGQQQQQQAPPSPEEVYGNATTMRIHGTCLPKCEKNVGQAKYAFNALQVKFMPDMLKPPANTLAGFLKGGSVFSGGFIES